MLYLYNCLIELRHLCCKTQVAVTLLTEASEDSSHAAAFEACCQHKGSPFPSHSAEKLTAITKGNRCSFCFEAAFAQQGLIVQGDQHLHLPAWRNGSIADYTHSSEAQRAALGSQRRKGFSSSFSPRP